MTERDALIREAFALDRDIGYRWFRAKFFADPEVVQEWPDAIERDRCLRLEWDALSEEHFARYRDRVKALSMPELTDYRDDLARRSVPRESEGNTRKSHAEVLDSYAGRGPTSKSPAKDRGPER